MEYKIIKKNKLDDKLTETAYYQIKKKSFLNIWYYPFIKEKKDDFIGSILYLNFWALIFIPLMIYLTEYGIYTALGFGIFNLSILIYHIKNIYVFDKLEDAEKFIKDEIKKKKFIKKEEIVSLISYKEDGLTIQK